MVCSTAILTSTLALSLLRYSSPPDQSFVLSPFSLTTTLAVIHDGAAGETKKELSNLLLSGCTDYNVTELYSSIAREIHTEGHVVTLTAANRFYVDETIALKSDYQNHVKDNYNVTVRNINLRDKKNAAKKMSKFVEKVSKGSIKNVVTAERINDNSLAFLINAVRFLGKWENQFDHSSTQSRMFMGLTGQRKMDFMQTTGHYRVNRDETFGTVLLLPYTKYGFNFFIIMSNEPSDIKQMRGELTGEKMSQIMQNSTSEYVHITVPKFKVESEFDGVEVLNKMGVTHLNDLPNISSTPFSVGQIKHSATIKTTEEGTEATAATIVQFVPRSSAFFNKPSYIVIDSPFLFGIMKNDHILFIGQYV